MAKRLTEAEKAERAAAKYAALLETREALRTDLVQAQNGDINAGTSRSGLNVRSRAALRGVEFVESKLQALMNLPKAETCFDRNRLRMFFYEHWDFCADKPAIREAMLAVEPRGADWLKQRSTTLIPDDLMPKPKPAPPAPPAPEPETRAEVEKAKLYTLLIGRGFSRELAYSEACDYAAKF